MLEKKFPPLRGGGDVTCAVAGAALALGKFNPENAEL